MLKIEACVHCDTLNTMTKSVRAAYDGGAARIELCADMSVDGLTPSREFIIAARENFDRPGVLVMIRPRGGDFCYDDSELHTMRHQINMAAECGADGVVFGILNKDSELADSQLLKMIEQCKKLGLQITCHRAFDATPNKNEALEAFIKFGVDRILTSGTQWGDGRGALDGVNGLGELIKLAADRIEIVIGGGVSPLNALGIVSQLPGEYERFSLHSYSGIQKDGVTDARLVESLVKAVDGM